MKRKHGQEIIDIPQPDFPELAFFDGDEMHRIIPIIARDGSATYDVSKMGAKAEALVEMAVAAKVKSDPAKVLRVLKAGDVVIDEVIL